MLLCQISDLHIRIGLADSAALEAIVRRHPRIGRILCGRRHRPIQVRFGGTLASTRPSPAHQVVLDLDPDAASQFTLEPPAFQLHLCHDQAGLISHTAFVGRFDEPYPFQDGDDLID